MTDAARFDLGPRPVLAYVGSAIARAAERRGDASFLEACAQAPEAGFYLVAGERVVLRKTAAGPDPLWPASHARALATAPESVFLGLANGAGRFALALETAEAEDLKGRGEAALIDLRSIAAQGLLAPAHLAPLAQAKAMLHWHARHRFCANCGAATAVSSAGWKRECPACGAEHFPRTDPVVIMLAIEGDGEDERCLLGRQARFAPRMWSCLAGFIEPGETLEEATRREIEEEAGVRCGAVSYFGSQPWPFPMSLMLGAHAQALTRELRIDRTELEDARWFSRREAAAMLARAHPDGLSTPPPAAIAHHIIRRWVELGSAFGAAAASASAQVGE